MNNDMYKLRGFIKERLIFMEALKSLSFITSLPFSSSTGPITLLNQLTQKDANTDISIYKYYLFDMILQSMLCIYEYDLNLVKNKAYVKNKIEVCLDLFKHFEVTKMILEEFSYKDISVAQFTNQDTKVLKLESYILRKMNVFNRSGETIFPEVGSVVQMVADKIHPRKHSPIKVAMLYSIVYLMELAIHGAFDEISNEDFKEAFYMLEDIMGRIGFNESLKDKRRISII